LQQSVAPLLRDPIATCRVRVCPGFVVRAYSVAAPGATESFGAGEVIPDFDVHEAIALSAVGAVEVI
jgi:hypothetical protein